MASGEAAFGRLSRFCALHRRSRLPTLAAKGGRRVAGGKRALVAVLGFFDELKRRALIRAAALYVGATWALAHGISQFDSAVGLPHWIAGWFLIAAAIGFPFWIAFARFCEGTPQGSERESEVAADASIVRSTGRKMDRAIIVVPAIAVAHDHDPPGNEWMACRSIDSSREAAAGHRSAIEADPRCSAAVAGLANAEAAIVDITGDAGTAGRAIAMARCAHGPRVAASPATDS